LGGRGGGKLSRGIEGKGNSELQREKEEEKKQKEVEGKSVNTVLKYVLEGGGNLKERER